MRVIQIVVVVLGVCGCASTVREPAMSATTGGNPADKPAKASDRHAPSPDRQLVDALTRALIGKDHEEAAAIIERARRAEAVAQPSAEALAYYDATVHAYRGDTRGAAEILRAYAAQIGPTAQAAFAFHDAMIALRAADGDLLGAIVECDEMVRVGMLGTWSPADRITVVRLKEYWHRAYLLRMAAQTLPAGERATWVAYAEQARQDYSALAKSLGELGDSIAVLNAYFAFCDGDRDKMREAARQVNVAADDDVEDLYLVQLAFEGAGENDAAAGVRARIAALPFVTVLTPVFLAWMRADSAGSAAHPFSPRYPAGARP